MSGPRIGGIPTDVDVRALFDAFGVLTVGASVTYDQVAATIHAPVRSNRFRTVTQAWRNRLTREHNLYLLARDGSFTAMSAPERIELGSAKLRTGVRAFRRAHTVVGATDRADLTDAQRAQADHVLMVSATALQAARLRAAKPGPPALPAPIGQKDR